MNFTEKLDILMAQHGLTRGSLAERADVPYNTIVGLYTKGYKNIKLSTLRRIAGVFNISLDILCDDDAPLESEEKQVLGALEQKISALSPKGRNLVETVVDGLTDLEAPERPSAKVEYIREYITPAAAGYASPAEGEDFHLVVRGADVPTAADFAVRISGDSMEPYIRDGSRVYVSRTNELSDGDVGIFFVDGDMKCKQYCEDNFGNIYLFSLNRARRDADSTIMASSGLTVFCFGKVLLGRRLPLPKR